MFLTKIWSVLVTLFALAVTVAFLLATPPAETQLEAAYKKQLDGAQGLVDSHLRMESRRRLDFVSSVGKDFKIVKLLKQLKGKDKATGAPLAKQLQSYLQEKLKGGKDGAAAFEKKYSAVEFTDVDGRVWARLGEQEGTYWDSLKNYSRISSPLERRLCSDDIALMEGVLYFVWSCPVRYVKDGEKIELVGAISARKKLDDSFAGSLLSLIGVTAEGEKGGKKDSPADKMAKEARGTKLKIQIAFFHKLQLVAQTGKSELWAQVKSIYTEHKKTVEDPLIGRSPAVERTAGGKRYLMVVGKLPGEVAGKGTVWAILWQFPTKLGPMAFMHSKLPKSELFKYMPTVLIVLLAIVALFLSVFFIFLEGDRPISRLVKQSRELSAGNLERLDDTLFRGRLGSVARSINESLERFADARPTKPALHDKDLDSILGGPDLATEDFTPPPAEAVSSAKPTGSVLDGFGSSDQLPAVASGGLQAGAPPPPPDLPSVPQSSLSPSGPVPFGGPKGIQAMTQPGPGPMPPPPPSGSLPALPANPAEAAFREVYDQFVATKQQCGESVEKLTFDAFSAKLHKNKQAVMDQTGCREVNFRVYIKDGKAALKATPVA